MFDSVVLAPTRRSLAAKVLALVNEISIDGESMTIDEAIEMASELALSGHVAELTTQRYRGLWGAFRRYCIQVGATTVDDLTPIVVERWIKALTRRGRQPDPATQRIRRTAIRHLFGVWRSVGVTRLDPTIDLALPPRRQRTCRALSEVELGWLRSASLKTVVETRQPTVLALAEAGLTPSEIPQVTTTDLDLARGRVWTAGHTKTDYRWAELSPWAVTQVGRRVRTLDDAQRPITYDGDGPISSAQASTSMALRSMLNRAGLGNDSDVHAMSLRVTYGLRAYQQRQRIDDAARALGMRSLDQTAAVLGLDWRAEP